MILKPNHAAAAILTALTLVAGCDKKTGSESKGEDGKPDLYAALLKERKESTRVRLFWSGNDLDHFRGDFSHP